MISLAFDSGSGVLAMGTGAGADSAAKGDGGLTLSGERARMAWAPDPAGGFSCRGRVNTFIFIKKIKKSRGNREKRGTYFEARGDWHVIYGLLELGMQRAECLTEHEQRSVSPPPGGELATRKRATTVKPGQERRVTSLIFSFCSSVVLVKMESATARISAYAEPRSADFLSGWVSSSTTLPESSSSYSVA